MIYLELFITFFMIGLFTFGGGYAMIPMMEQVLVEKGWVSSIDIVNFIAISESTPGVFAVNMATFTGFKTAGTMGGIIATIGLIVPSVVIITVIAKLFSKFKQNNIIGGIQIGIRPVVLGLLISIVISFMYQYFIPSGFAAEITINFNLLLICLLCGAIKLKYRRLSPIFIIIVGAILGIALL